MAGFTRFVPGALACALGLVSGASQATNGLFMPGFGVRAQGMGGVGIAYGRDALSAAANPANLANVGMRGDIGFSIFNAEAGAETGITAGATAPQSTFGLDGEAESEARMYLMPEMGMAMPLSDRLFAGFAMVPLGGGGTDYPYNFFSYDAGGSSTPSSDTPLGIELIILQAPISLAYKLDENHTVGAALAINVARFKAFGLQAFTTFDKSVTAITADPEHVTGQGSEWAFGAGLKLGWQGEFLDDRLTLGLVYNSKGYMTKFDLYSGLFPEQGRLDIPASYGAGFALRPVRNLVIAFDAMRVQYSGVPATGNLGPGTRPAGGTALTGIPSNGSVATGTPLELGNDDGMGFGMKDQTIYKLGVQYGVNQRLQVRGGYNYSRSPFPNDQATTLAAGNSQLTFATLAPAVSQHHWTAGFTYKASDELEISGNYLYSPLTREESPGRQNVVGEVNVEMEQQVFGVSLGWILDPGPSEYGAAPVSADPWGLYAGVGLGSSWNRDWDAESLNGILASHGYTGSTDTDHSDGIDNIGWKFYGGYKFNRYVSVEGGYVNFIDQIAGASISAPAAGQQHLNLESNAWLLGVVGYLPVTKSLSVIGKLGANYSHYKLKSVDTVAGPTGRGATLFVDEEEGTGIYAGVGVDYALASNFSLRAEFERFDVNGSNVDMLTGGFAFGF
jgi:long-chain fatty acid transport protein